MRFQVEDVTVRMTLNGTYAAIGSDHPEATALGVSATMLIIATFDREDRILLKKVW